MPLQLEAAPPEADCGVRARGAAWELRVPGITKTGTYWYPWREGGSGPLFWRGVQNPENRQKRLVRYA